MKESARSWARISIESVSKTRFRMCGTSSSSLRLSNAVSFLAARRWRCCLPRSEVVALACVAREAEPPAGRCALALAAAGCPCCARDSRSRTLRIAKLRCVRVRLSCLRREFGLSRCVGEPLLVPPPLAACSAGSVALLRVDGRCAAAAAAASSSSAKPASVVALRLAA
eukprot:6208376-Pleurochrysis_carterae.AAC.1